MNVRVKKNNKLNSVDLRVGKINVYVPNINFSEKTKQTSGTIQSSDPSEY